MPIDLVDLTAVDLNLLVALDALLSERSVTKAAARTGVGQSAMSSSLARLRHLFGDELLTRSNEGMRPTPRAMAIAEPLRLTLRQIQGLVRHAPAPDLGEVRRVFHVAMPDSLEVLLLPRLLAHLRAEAPGLSLQLSPFNHLSVLSDLDADRLDLGLGVLGEGQVHHKQRLLFKDDFLCLFSAEMLGIDAPVSMEDYLRFPHVLTSMNDTSHGVVDIALEELGLRRTLALRTPRFLAVPFIVKSAPVMTTMVTRLATVFAEAHNLCVSPPPMTIAPVATSMVWHSSYDADPVHGWLRDSLVRICRTI